MGDHFVPRFYLQGFSEDKSIWVYEKGNKKPFKTTTKNVAQENKLYSKELEQYLANIVESPANIILDKIRKRERISDEDKVVFARYMITMWKRVPKQREWTVKKGEAIFDTKVKEVKERIDGLKSSQPSKADAIDKLKDRFEMQANEEEDEFLYHMWLDNIDPDATPKSVKTLAMMTWRIMISGGEEKFLTSDNPLFFFQGIGIGNEKSEVSFPVSTNYSLWATWRHNYPEDYVSVRRQIVKEINRRTISNAKRFIYSPKPVPWLMSLLNKKTIRLNRITFDTVK